MALRSNAKIELLKSVPLFAGCSKAELRRLASIADEIDLRARNRPDAGRAHRARVLRPDRRNGPASTKSGRKVADLGAGDWLGEIALLTRAPRTATVTATSPLRTLVITDREFRRLVSEVPSIAMKVLGGVAERLSRTPQS